MQGWGWANPEPILVQLPHGMGEASSTSEPSVP